jgi:hypothetical protein
VFNHQKKHLAELKNVQRMIDGRAIIANAAIPEAYSYETMIESTKTHT